MNSLDETAFRAINGLTGSGGFVDAFSVFLSSWLLVLTVVVLVLLGLRALWHPVGRVGRRRAAHEIAMMLRASLAAFGVVVDGLIISLIWFRPRPFVTLLDVNQLIDAPISPKSFPSDHASMSFAVAAAVVSLHPWLGLVLFVAAVGVSLGRVLVGVHYPGDVLAGAILGATWGLVVALIGRQARDVSRIERLLKRRENKKRASRGAL